MLLVLLLLSSLAQRFARLLSFIFSSNVTAVGCCDVRGMGIQLSRLESDSSKGKCLSKNNKTLVNFVSRKPAALQSKQRGSEEANEEATDKEDTTAGNNGAFYELPSISQIDLSVLHQLPESVQREIGQYYDQKSLIKDAMIAANQVRPPPDQLVASEHNRAGQASRSLETPYDAIDDIGHIDRDFWQALPDDIKEEIKRNIEFNKCRSSPTKSSWLAIFKKNSNTKVMNHLSAGVTNTNKRTTKRGKAFKSTAPSSRDRRPEIGDQVFDFPPISLRRWTFTKVNFIPAIETSI